MSAVTPEHESAYAYESSKIYKAIKSIQKAYLTERRQLDKTIFDKEARDEGTELDRYNEKKAVKAILRETRKIALNQLFETLQKENQHTFFQRLQKDKTVDKTEKKQFFKKIELEYMVSDAMNKLFEKEKTRDFSAHSIKGFTYRATLPPRSIHQQEVIGKIMSDEKAVKEMLYHQKQTTLFIERTQEKAKLAALLPEVQKQIRINLKKYVKRLIDKQNILKLRGQKLPENEIWFKSNQVEKLKIAEMIISVVEKPITSLTLIEISTALIENQKATGNKLMHGRGCLHVFLKNAEKLAIKKVANGKAISELHHYIYRTEKEIAKTSPTFYKYSAFASDLPKKVALAKKSLTDFQNGYPSKSQIESLIQENILLTQKAGFHRAGKLHAILKEAQKNLLTPSSKNIPS